MVKPQDIIVRRVERLEGWIPTFSGSGFHPITPQVSEVAITDIARGLAYKYRYGGHGDPITVAEHSLLVADIITTLWPNKTRGAISGLLHDACEAYTQDIQAPFRKQIRVLKPDGSLITWGEMEKDILLVIQKALKIKGDLFSPEVRAADILALALEKKQSPILQQYEDSWGIPEIPSELRGLYLQYLSPQDAYVAFLDRFESLL